MRTEKIKTGSYLSSPSTYQAVQYRISEIETGIKQLFIQPERLFKIRNVAFWKNECGCKIECVYVGNEILCAFTEYPICRPIDRLVIQINYTKISSDLVVLVDGEEL